MQQIFSPLGNDFFIFGDGLGEGEGEIGTLDGEVERLLVSPLFSGSSIFTGEVDVDLF